ncbi:MAG: flagellar protein FliT [Herbaspirillum sp.]
MGMNSVEVISLYETVADITEQMLVAARNNDWDQLAALEQHCSNQVARLKVGETPEPLSGNVRQKKVEIIKKILADDREIRNLTEPWMHQLTALMHNASTERKLNQVYGAQPAR